MLLNCENKSVNLTTAWFMTLENSKEYFWGGEYLALQWVFLGDSVLQF